MFGTSPRLKGWSLQSLEINRSTCQWRRRILQQVPKPYCFSHACNNLKNGREWIFGQYFSKTPTIMVGMVLHVHGSNMLYNMFDPWTCMQRAGILKTVPYLRLLEALKYRTACYIQHSTLTLKCTSLAPTSVATCWARLKIRNLGSNRIKKRVKDTPQDSLDSTSSTLKRKKITFVDQ